MAINSECFGNGQFLSNYSANKRLQLTGNFRTVIKMHEH